MELWRLSESSLLIAHTARSCLYKPFPLQDSAKRVEFDKCKVRLVVQGQHMRRKGEDGVSDYDDAFNPVPAASGFCIILSLATQQNMFTDHVDIFQASVQGALLPRDVTMERCIFLDLWDMMKILSICIACLSHLTACPLQPELGTPP